MDSIKVAIRVRPLIKSEIERGCLNCVLADSVNRQIIVNNNADLTYTFNYVFTPEHSQNQIFKLAVEDLITKLFSGFNVTIFAYGQTGSGKTHSMGTNCVDENNIEEEGIIPRAIQNIFSEVQKKAEEAKFLIKASFIELYQEQLYDLLSPNKAILNIREDYIPGLKEIIVTDFSTTLECFIKGSNGRVTGATAMNAQSSRSHCIFTLNISQMREDGNNTTAKFHLVDLAGSERSKKTKATGERFKESITINKELLSLGNVINSLCEKSTHISYRGSKLTRLLQDSLGGNSVTLMIACISPADYNIDETLSTLRYANRVLKIKNKPVANQHPINGQIPTHFIKNYELKLKRILTEVGNIQKIHINFREEICFMNQKLNDYVTQSESLNMNVLLLAINRHITMKKKLGELKMDFNKALKRNDIMEFQKINEKFNIIVNEHNNIKIRINNNGCVTTDSEDNKGDVFELDKYKNDRTKEQMVMEIIQLNHKNRRLKKELAMRDQLATKMVVSDTGNWCPEENIEELKINFEKLKQERDKLLEVIKAAQSNNNNSKLSEQQHRKLHDFEQKNILLTKKCLEKEKIIKMKDKNVENLNHEITSLKATKVKLTLQLKNENEKFRQFKSERDREICRLKENEYKQQNHMMRIEDLNNRQQTALKRKLEESVNLNKRLKETLGIRKAIEVKRDETFIPKTQRIQKWINDELDMIMSIVATEKTLEQLEIDRENIHMMANKCEEQLETSSGLHDEVKYDLILEKRDISEKLQQRSDQIIEFRQKIFDSNEELMRKNRFDHFKSITDSKIALRHLFHVSAETKKATIHLQDQINQLNNALNQANDTINVEKKKTFDAINQSQKQIEQVQNEYEDNIFVLIRQLNEKDRLYYNGSELAERLRIYDEQLSKYEQLKEELYQKELIILDLQAIIKNSR